MYRKLAEVRVAASCGHPEWAAVLDCEDGHNAEQIRRTAGAPCRRCREVAARRAHLPDRVKKLLAAAASAPPMPDMPQGRIEIIPTPDGWQATLSTGVTGTAKSPTGAVLAAFAAQLEREYREGETASA